MPSVLVCSIELPPPKQGPSHRTCSRISGRTSLRPARAYCLCLLHPDLAPVQPGIISKRASKIFLDPCGGLGSIPLELAAISRRDSLKITCLSSDIELPSLEGAAKNFAAAEFASSAGLAGVDTPILLDGRGMGKSGGFRQNALDGISGCLAPCCKAQLISQAVTDLPFGIRELSASATASLYPLLLRVLATCTAPGAHGVFLTAKKKYFEHAVNENQAQWKSISERVSICTKASSDFWLSLCEDGECGRYTGVCNAYKAESGRRTCQACMITPRTGELPVSIGKQAAKADIRVDLVA